MTAWIGRLLSPFPRRLPNPAPRRATSGDSGAPRGRPSKPRCTASLVQSGERPRRFDGVRGRELGLMGKAMGGRGGRRGAAHFSAPDGLLQSPGPSRAKRPPRAGTEVHRGIRDRRYRDGLPLGWTCPLLLFWGPHLSGDGATPIGAVLFSPRAICLGPPLITRQPPHPFSSLPFPWPPLEAGRCKRRRNLTLGTRAMRPGVGLGPDVFFSGRQWNLQSERARSCSC